MAFWTNKHVPIIVWKPVKKNEKIIGAPQDQIFLIFFGCSDIVTDETVAFLAQALNVFNPPGSP